MSSITLDLCHASRTGILLRAALCAARWVAAICVSALSGTTPGLSVFFCDSEAFAALVTVPVFKTGEISSAGLVGSIPIRFRSLTLHRFDSFSFAG